jgi:hypothetical protein
MMYSLTKFTSRGPTNVCARKRDDLSALPTYRYKYCHVIEMIHSKVYAS